MSSLLSTWTELQCNHLQYKQKGLSIEGQPPAWLQVNKLGVPMWVGEGVRDVVSSGPLGRRGGPGPGVPSEQV